jgi:hypothetical protein
MVIGLIALGFCQLLTLYVLRQQTRLVNQLAAQASQQTGLVNHLAAQVRQQGTTVNDMIVIVRWCADQIEEQSEMIEWLVNHHNGQTKGEAHDHEKHPVGWP